MIPPYFFTETTETEIFQINWNAIFCINYLIISLLEEKKAFPFQLFQLFQLIFQHIPPTPIFIYIIYIINCKRLRVYTLPFIVKVLTFAP